MRDNEVPELRPEQQIQNEEEIRTPPRREPRGVESHQPKGPRIVMNESVSKPTIQRVVTGGNIGRHIVSYATGPR